MSHSEKGREMWFSPLALLVFVKYLDLLKHLSNKNNFEILGHE